MLYIIREEIRKSLKLFMEEMELTLQHMQNIYVTTETNISLVESVTIMDITK